MIQLWRSRQQEADIIVMGTAVLRAAPGTARWGLCMLAGWIQDTGPGPDRRDGPLLSSIFVILRMTSWHCSEHFPQITLFTVPITGCRRCDHDSILQMEKGRSSKVE